MVDSSATEHQISDGVGVSIRATPADGFTSRGAHPDHAFLAPQFGDPESVVHVLCPIAPVRIELSPCGGLDCDGVVHGSFRFDVTSIRARMPLNAAAKTTLRNVTSLPMAGSEGME
ncbi:hypothetical protein [Synechococcus phage S-B43]|nr:hypothetical protein [Synechococcus phage S-B43]